MPEQQQRSAPVGEPTPVSAWVGQQESPREVVITRLDIPFLDLLIFFIKAGLASIPAAIIVGIIYGIIYTRLSSFFLLTFCGFHRTIYFQ